MTQPAKGKRSTRPKGKAVMPPIARDVELPTPERSCRDEPAESEIILRNTLCRHLHDLLNALWPVAVRIDLSISDATCPPQFHAILTELGRCVEEAMTIAAEASALVGPTTSTRIP